MQQSRGKKEPCSPTVLFFFPLTSEHAIGPNGRVESWRPSPKGTPTDRKQYPPIFLTFLWPAVYVRANIWRIPLRSVGGDIHTVVRVTNGSGRGGRGGRTFPHISPPCPSPRPATISLGEEEREAKWRRTHLHREAVAVIKGAKKKNRQTFPRKKLRSP